MSTRNSSRFDAARDPLHVLNAARTPGFDDPVRPDLDFAAALRDRTWLAMAAFAAVAVLGVLARPLLPIDETRYLAVAWEMRLHGDWIVPQLNGLPYSHKPPLLFWLINLVWSVTGVSGTAARLVAPAFGVAAIWFMGILSAGGRGRGSVGKARRQPRRRAW